jgi:TorA maturation chaperone TorD
MRYLIAGEDLGVCNLRSQKEFFNEHIRPWASQLFDAIETHPNTLCYRQVSQFTRLFFDIEGQAFDMT